MSPAMMAATKMLKAQRKATRRILVVMTDGGCRWNAQGTRFAARYAAAHQVETIGIGIGCDPGPAFEHCVSVQTIKALGAQGLGTLLATLKRAA